MFDKLKSLFEKESQPEHKSDGKSTLIGADPFNRKSEIGTEERIQGKIQLLKQLQEELNEYGKT